MLMRKLRSMQRLGVWMALAVIVVQPQWVLAGELPRDGQTTSLVEQARVERALSVIDVAIDHDGMLRGQLVDKQGHPLSGYEIRLSNGQSQWRTQTDEQGRFQFAGLSGATYRAQVGEQIQLMRVWSAGTAPPSASQGLLFVQDGDVVLAQDCGTPVCGSPVKRRRPLLANPWIFGGLVAAAIAIPVAIHNADDDDPPASP